MIFRRGIYEYTIDPEEDLVNPEDMIPYWESNPHQVRPWILHDAGFVVGVVFADCLQDALDEAADKDCLDRFQVAESEMKDYQTGTDSEGNPEYDRISFLGNASEPFDIEALDVVEVRPSEWGIEFWSKGQIVYVVESILDDLTPTEQGCGRTDAYIDMISVVLAGLLKELNKRRG